MTILLGRRFRIDATTDLTLASGWLEVKRTQNTDPNVTANIEDASSDDTNGVESGEVTMISGGPSFSFFSQLVSAVRDPGQSIIMATYGQFGNAARCGLRWYDRNGLADPQNGSAVILPTIKRSQTGVKNLEMISITSSIADGILNIGITNPGTAATVPVILSATPNAQNSGKILTITGAAFTGTTGVTIGGTAATSFVVQSDNMITAVLPTASAGSAPVIVTNAVGASASFPFTRGS